jgi:hypothetical protein
MLQADAPGDRGQGPLGLLPCFMSIIPKMEQKVTPKSSRRTPKAYHDIRRPKEKSMGRIMIRNENDGPKALKYTKFKMHVFGQNDYLGS